MKYYAKMTGPHSGGWKVYVEIWEIEENDGFVIDNMIKCKTFFTHYGAKKWIEKTIMKLVMKNKMHHFFITDVDIVRKDLV